jgi:hypothetical protein
LVAGLGLPAVAKLRPAAAQPLDPLLLVAHDAVPQPDHGIGGEAR